MSQTAHKIVVYCFISLLLVSLLDSVFLKKSLLKEWGISAQSKAFTGALHISKYEVFYYQGSTPFQLDINKFFREQYFFATARSYYYLFTNIEKLSPWTFDRLSKNLCFYLNSKIENVERIKIINKTSSGMLQKEYVCKN